VAQVVGVVFPNGTKTYHFDPADLELTLGDRVVVQTLKGTEIGQVAEPPHSVPDSDLQAPLKKIMRVATEEDVATAADGYALRKKAMIACRELIYKHGLDMKLVDAEISFGGEKAIFSFYAEDRIDFRALVADLAKDLKMRVELRQIGAREEARMVGGLGPCGRRLCCTLFAGDEEPVSIRMAKEQNLPLNPMKISGLCGRLMCCLKYEQEQYVTFRKEAPSKGTPVHTERGDGVVCGYNALKEAVNVRFEGGGNGEVRLCNCRRDEDGGLICEVEEEQAPEIDRLQMLNLRASGLSGASFEAPEAGEPGAHAGAVTPAEVVGEEGSSASAQSEAGSGRRSRRSRSRRGGRGRRPAANGGVGESAANQGAPDQGAGAKPRGAGGGPRPKRPEATAEGNAAAGSRSGADTTASSSGGEKKPRRRRRPRRRPGGAGSPEGTGSSSGGGGSPESGQ
jgi:cell fate regulator YaaT (PSP1 superfamily)